MSRLTDSEGEVIGIWRNIVCSLGFHVWFTPQIAVMESFVHGNELLRSTNAVRISECSKCTKVTIERI